jgi:hypothetical protein
MSKDQNRFSYPKQRAAALVPGPGVYQPKLDFSNKGTYSVAKFRNSGAPLFSRAGRDTNLDTSATRKSNL